MLNDSLTISLLPALDATLHPDGEWLFPGMESRMNENGVYTEDIKDYKAGKWNTYSVELKIAAVCDKVYYEFGLTSGMIDNYYGSYSTLDNNSKWVHRNNTIDNLRGFIVNVFVNSVLPYDRNLCDKSRKELEKLIKKLVKEIEA